MGVAAVCDRRIIFSGTLFERAGKSATVTDRRYRRPNRPAAIDNAGRIFPWRIFGSRPDTRSSAGAFARAESRARISDTGNYSGGRGAGFQKADCGSGLPRESRDLCTLYATRLRAAECDGDRHETGPIDAPIHVAKCDQSPRRRDLPDAGSARSVNVLCLRARRTFEGVGSIPREHGR